MSELRPRELALEIRENFRFEPTSLITYRSAGKILVLGDEAGLQRCNELPSGLDLLPIAAAAGASVDGYLGNFRLTVTDTHANQVTHHGDAILDLHENAVVLREMLPPGYFHMPPSRWGDSELIAELETLVGEFEKPKFFDYDPSICAHAVNGQIVCSQCIDACPAEAIQSLGERIDVDPQLCQGGGSCTTVCPSGAIRYLYPNLRDNGSNLRDMLARYRQHGGQQPVVLFHAEAVSPQAYLDAADNLLPIAVEELASVGMDLCLAALAYGAHQVVLLVDSEVPVGSLHQLRLQLDWVHALLAGLGLGSAYVTLCDFEAAIPEVDARDVLKPAVYDMPMGKRQAIYQALDHLVAQLQPSVDRVELPASAPFGDVTIDAEKCTLCMACVGACPGRALQDGSNREIPEVFFIETNCLQCGACLQTCPEAAVSLSPRLLFDLETRNRSRALNRDTPFACIACGKPFAPTSVIDKMQDKLKNHHMFGSQRALDRLKMCDDCRVADVMQDPDAMGGGQFNPLKNFEN